MTAKMRSSGQRHAWTDALVAPLPCLVRLGPPDLQKVADAVPFMVLSCLSALSGMVLLVTVPQLVSRGEWGCGGWCRMPPRCFTRWVLELALQ